MNNQVLLLFLTFLIQCFGRVPIDRFSDPCIFIDCNKYKAKTMAPSTPKPIETGVIQAQLVSFLEKTNEGFGSKNWIIVYFFSVG